jgi:hypothetical protein
MTKANALPKLSAAFDAESWEWLQENRVALATALKSEVDRGATPEQIRYFVMNYAQRAEIALRLEQAARHLRSLQE